MDARTIIDMLGAGQSAEAKEGLEELLSAKAMDALDAKKQEIGSTLFNGKVEQPTEEERLNSAAPQLTSFLSVCPAFSPVSLIIQQID